MLEDITNHRKTEDDFVETGIKQDGKEGWRIRHAECMRYMEKTEGRISPGIFYHREMRNEMNNLLVDFGLVVRYSLVESAR